GPWEVTVKTSTAAALITAVAKFGSYVRIVPPEVVAKYGDMSKWYNAVGTGPFLLTDYVPGSQALLPRNPNYWKKNPVGPGTGDQVPYIDALQYLIIPDASTRLAALRTGKLDRMANLTFEDAGQIRKNGDNWSCRCWHIGKTVELEAKAHLPEFLHYLRHHPWV
ncbi:MAG: Extracellular solute-binding protein, family 5, partial [Parcubacteria group bacterium GW2011_GWC2_42_13]